MGLIIIKIKVKIKCDKVVIVLICGVKNDAFTIYEVKFKFRIFSSVLGKVMVQLYYILKFRRYLAS